MKAILFAVLTTLTASASAVDSIYVSAKLTRNGEIVDNCIVLAANGVTQLYRNVEFIKYRSAVKNSKVNLTNLEVGTTASFTPAITSEGDIRLDLNVSYVRLKKMDAAKVGSFYIDLPLTEGYKNSTSLLVPDGEAREYRSFEDGVEYIYTVSATKS